MFAKIFQFGDEQVLITKHWDGCDSFLSVEFEVEGEGLVGLPFIYNGDTSQGRAALNSRFDRITAKEVKEIVAKYKREQSAAA